MEAVIVLIVLFVGLALALKLFYWLSGGSSLVQSTEGGGGTTSSHRDQRRTVLDPSEERSSRCLNEQECAELFVPGSDGRVAVRISEGASVHVGSGRLSSPGNRHMMRLGARSVNVRGLRYYPSAVLAAGTSPGTPAIFRREPDSPHDENAVAVEGLDSSGTERRIGFVSKGLGRRLSKQLDAGGSVDAWFMRGSPAGEDYDGVAVLLTDQATKSEWFEGREFIPRR